jgi:uncharacterized protein (DUF2147 family)
MTLIRLILLFLIATAILPTIAVAQAEVTGLWRTEDTERGHLEINISPCGAALCGIIVAARSAQAETSPYEHLNRRMVWDMQATSKPGSWTGGKIWDPRNGRTFNSRMALEKGKLKVSGCVLGVCQSQTWTRVR